MVFVLCQNSPLLCGRNYEPTNHRQYNKSMPDDSFCHPALIFVDSTLLRKNFTLPLLPAVRSESAPETHIRSQAAFFPALIFIFHFFVFFFAQYTAVLQIAGAKPKKHAHK